MYEPLRGHTLLMAEVKKTNFLSRGKPLIWLGLVCIYIFAVLPLSVFSLYQSELNFGLVTLLGYIFILTLLAVLFSFAVLWKLPGAWQGNLGVFALIVSAYIFYNFSFTQYGGKIIDADPDVFDKTHSLIFYAAASAIVGLAVVFRKKIRTHLLPIFLIFIFANGGNLLFSLAQTSPPRTDSSGSTGSFENNFFSFSDERNIIHIVLDGMQGTLFSQIVQENQDISAAFQGFVHFPDTLASTDITYLSTAATLSGKPFYGEGLISDYMRGVGMSAENDDGTDSPLPPLLAALRDNNFDLDILAAPGSGMLARKHYRNYDNTDFDGPATTDKGFAKLLDLTLVRILPWPAKRYIYKNGSWHFSRETKQTPRANRAANFLRNFGRDIQLNNQKPTYKYIHVLTPHGPWTTAADCVPAQATNSKSAIYIQTECALRAAIVLLEDMKSSKVFGNSLILIHGDHGICQSQGLPNGGAGNENFPKCIGNSNPLFLIKKPNAEHALFTNNRPAALTDIAATILDTLSIPHQIDGINVMGNAPRQSRDRYYYQFKPNRVEAARLDRVTHVRRFNVRGSMLAAKSWLPPLDQDHSIEEEQLKHGGVLKIDQWGQSGSSIWVVTKGAPPKRHMYLVIEGKKTLISISKNTFTFPVPNLFPDTDIALIDPVRLMKQKLNFKSNIFDDITLASLTEGTIITIERKGRSGSSIWVVWSEEGNPASQNMYVESDGKRYSLTLAKSHFTFRTPESFASKPLYLIDPDKLIKQEIKFTLTNN